MSSGPMSAAAGWSSIAFLAALRLRRRGWSGRLDRGQNGVERSNDVVRHVDRRAGRQGAADFDHDVGATLGHDRLVDRAELGLDLLLDVALVTLDLLLLAA